MMLYFPLQKKIINVVRGVHQRVYDRVFFTRKTAGDFTKIFVLRISYIALSVTVYLQLVIISCLQFQSGVVITNFGMPHPVAGWGWVPTVGVPVWVVQVLYLVTSGLIVFTLWVGTRAMLDLYNMAKGTFVFTGFEE